MEIDGEIHGAIAESGDYSADPLPSMSSQAGTGHWRLERRPKFAGIGVVRTVSPRTTIRRVGPLMERIGVTRIGEVTHLDRNGLANFIAVRPRDLGRGISYYNGKGATRTQARASALMEAIERFSGESCDLPVVVSSFERLRRDATAIDPADLLAPMVREYSPSLPLEWVCGYDLLGACPIYVPLNSVVCPYRPERAPALFHASSNGLASGNTLEEALCHALCEVNERDATSLYDATSRLRPEVSAAYSRLGLAATPSSEPLRPHAMIEHEELPPRATRLLRRLKDAGLLVYLRDITSDTGVATIGCVVAERKNNGVHLAHGGFGSHPDARVALTRALTEAAQSRVGFIQGGREDLADLNTSRTPLLTPEVTFGAGPKKPFSEVASHEFASNAEDVEWILGRFRAAGFSRAVAVDLTRPEVGVPVVRVVVPGAEAWSSFHMHSSRGALGPRALSLIA
jgi:ribosomal protein S12 methylthiotransferase accessory factor